MSKVGNSLNVPNFLVAPSREELVRLMLSNNLKAGKEHRYFDISFDGKAWCAWYYVEANVKESLRGKKVLSDGSAR